MVSSTMEIPNKPQKLSAPFSIPFASYRFRLKALNPIGLPPYKGAVLRGGFGITFKRIVCSIGDKECGECLLRERCVYSYIFETPPPRGTEIMRKYQAAPHPFVIEPPMEEKKVYEKGEEILFNLILIGKAIDSLPYFIYTFEELGKKGIGRGRGKYELAGVEQEELSLYTSQKKKLERGGEVRSTEEFFSSQAPFSQITLNFVTPTRIVREGKLTEEVSFATLIRVLLRRISLLSYFHCGQDRSDFDFKGTIEKAGKIEILENRLKWKDWERYSTRQKASMILGGITGDLQYQGEITPFLPYLKIGEALHVGKGTGFGLGKYEIAYRP